MHFYLKPSRIRPGRTGRSQAAPIAAVSQLSAPSSTCTEKSGYLLVNRDPAHVRGREKGLPLRASGPAAATGNLGLRKAIAANCRSIGMCVLRGALAREDNEMNFFSNLTIRGKIILVVLLIIGLELILAASTLYFLGSVNSSMSRIVQYDAEKMRLAARVKTGMLEVHRAQKNIILSSSLAQIEPQMESKRHSAEGLRTDLAELDRFIYQQERLTLRDLHYSLNEFLAIDTKIEAMVLDHSKNSSTTPGQSAAVELSTGSGRAAYDRASEMIDQIVKNADRVLDDHRSTSMAYFRMALIVVLVLCAAGIGGGLSIGFLAARTISGNLQRVVRVTDAIARGDLETQVTVASRDETGLLAESIQQMQAALIRAANENAVRDYVKSGLARINDAMHGQVNVRDLCAAVINEMATYVDARVGAIFLLNGRGPAPVLEFSGGYAYENAGRFPHRFSIGEGLVGQAALSKAPIRVHDIPADYIKVCSGLGDSCPTSITIAPLMFEDRLSGVVELGFLQPATEVQLDCVQQMLPAVAVTIETVRGREDLSQSLARAQVLTEELQQQQDELKAVNEELEEQTQRLRQSEERLRNQQEELETVNSELEEKNRYLENNKSVIEQSNRELERTRLEIEEKADQLAQASRYKSEFLANMSHELRTPLNSILLLARMLCENKDGHLTEEQVQSANIILSSGNDLLALINEVLDLAKIEAGRMELQVEPVDLREVADGIGHKFGHLIEEKGLRLEVHTAETCPVHMVTDRKRLGQILRNLISNAIKFTDRGGINVHIARPGAQELIPAGMHKETTVAIAIRDSGIGIAPDKQRIVFEAFQQLDSGAARKFPGTGLGLSISRELAHLLGGEILLHSTPGAGSTFTLYLPDEIAPARQGPAASSPAALPESPSRPKRVPLAQPAAAVVPEIQDDRNHITEADTSILIIEDDPVFARHLMDLCRQNNCKVLFSPSGEQGLSLAETQLPKGIFLDIRLPGRDGWSVLASLKENPKTRHIPVHIVSVEDVQMAALERGAIGFMTKPVEKAELEKALGKLEDVFNRPMKELLVVEDNEQLRHSTIALVGNGDVHSDEAGSAAEAMRAVQSKRYDCMILDLGLPDMNGLDMLKLLEKNTEAALPPVIVFTGRELTRQQESELRRYSESIIIKGVCSQERLLDEASLFLHRMVDKLPERKRKLITNLHDCDVIFRGKTVLIVDDDMRNLFALSKLLAEKGVVALKAENGQKALELLDAHAGIDLVLMDMMMPVMDGYETMQRIRAQERFRTLPVIALTAKAMAQDRDRCIQSGANDYLSKPVDLMRLFSMMRVWLYR
ncbi:MAG: response regulator [Desulfobacteraceae bacterium]|nr:MAG: response regulator [Desulfobacteraceae bacterium]